MTNPALVEAWRRELEAYPLVVQEVFDQARAEAQKVLGQRDKSTVRTRIKVVVEEKIPEGADVCGELIAWDDS